MEVDYNYMNKRRFAFSSLFTIAVMITVFIGSHYYDKPSESSQDTKDLQVDTKVSHKVITDKETLERIRKEEGFTRTPNRVEYDYNGQTN
jgi:amino acid permease